MGSPAGSMAALSQAERITRLTRARNSTSPSFLAVTRWLRCLRPRRPESRCPTRAGWPPPGRGVPAAARVFGAGLGDLPQHVAAVERGARCTSSSLRCRKVPWPSKCRMSAGGGVSSSRRAWRASRVAGCRHSQVTRPGAWVSNGIHHRGRVGAGVEEAGVAGPAHHGEQVQARLVGEPGGCPARRWRRGCAGAR